MLTQRLAQGNGFSDVVYLDSKTDTYLEEVSSCNIFVVKGKTIKTPPLSGTILPGVTRESILQLAATRGYVVQESPVPVLEALEVWMGWTHHHFLQALVPRSHGLTISTSSGRECILFND